ncbi:hypothetical protein IH992_33450 [Candidatus Poribacteria bacterium]|nr:hypothetical protein [Candidatus Poribacteria bacterium]
MLDELAIDLKRRVGRGFTKRYLELFRQFYRCYPIAKSVISKLGITLADLPSSSAQEDSFTLDSQRLEELIQ